MIYGARYVNTPRWASAAAGRREKYISYTQIGFDFDCDFINVSAFCGPNFDPVFRFEPNWVIANARNVYEWNFVFGLTADAPRWYCKLRGCRHLKYIYISVFIMWAWYHNFKLPFRLRQDALIQDIKRSCFGLNKQLLLRNLLGKCLNFFYYYNILFKYAAAGSYYKQQSSSHL